MRVFALFVLASIFALSLAQDTKISFGFENLVGKYGSGFGSESGVVLDCPNPPNERVFLPKSNPDTVLGVLGQDPVFAQTLVRWIKQSGLTQLYNSNPITVFVPSPYIIASAYDRIQKLELPENAESLRRLLQFWVSPSYISTSKFETGLKLKTVLGQPIEITITSAPFANGAYFDEADIVATNGIIHTIGDFLMPKDIVQLLQANGNFNSLLSAVKATGLTLSADMDYTLFAPTDAAFAKLPTGALKALLTDSRKLQATLQYHLIGSRVQSSDAKNGAKLATVNGGQYVDVTLGEYIFVNKQRVSQTDVVAANGLIHVIDGVLTLKNLVQVATDFGFNTFVTAVSAANLTGLLTSEGKRTVFIPTDQAFADLPAGVLAALSQPSGQKNLIQLLSNHVVNQDVYSDQLYNGQTLLTAAGSYLTINKNITGVTVNGALVTMPDEITSTGVAHVINKVLLPNSVSQILAQSGQFSTLINLLGLINFQGIPGAGFYTLFAPTDAAFAKLGATATRLVNNRAALSTVLTYHVLPGAVCSSQLSNNLQLTTVQGSNVTITLPRGASPKVNQANILFLDHLGSDGIVHFIDDVLLPPNFVLP